MDSKLMEDVLVVAIVAAKGLLDVVGGRRRDRRHGESSAAAERFRMEVAKQYASVQLELQQLRAFVVGPDGENGIRGDLREVKARVIGLEQRERGRLEPHQHQVGTFQPPGR